MDGAEDEAGYPPNQYGVNHHQGYGDLSHRRLPVRSSPYSQPVVNDNVEDNDDDDEENEDEEEPFVEEEDDDDDDDQSNRGCLPQRNVAPDNDDEGNEDKDGDENDGNNDDEDDEGNEDKNGDENDGDGDDYDDVDSDDAKPKVYSIKDEDDLEWHPKKRKLKSLLSAYEFAPRLPAPMAATPSAPKPSYGGRKSLSDWTEPETFVLLDAWGDKFLQNGRKSLRSEEWQEVAEKVTGVSKIVRTDAQCRNRLDTLKKKYKTEKTKLEKMGGRTSKWVYFHRMDKLMSSPSPQAGLSCGMDSGEYVFMNPRVYLHHANGLDEMRDSPRNSESTDEKVSDGLNPKKKRSARDGDRASSFRLLANSIHKFSDIFEKIENNKRQQMLELENMRMEIYKDMETQKRQILERVQSEISKLHQRDDEENNE